MPWRKTLTLQLKPNDTTYWQILYTLDSLTHKLDTRQIGGDAHGIIPRVSHIKLDLP
jgi:hypothetical protein